MAVERGRRRALFRDKLPQERCRVGRSPAPEASRDMAQNPQPPQFVGMEHHQGKLPAHPHQRKPKACFPSTACLLGAKS